MKLYLIRHGESEANIKDVFGGQTQVPLTARGEEEARNAKKLLDGLTFDKVYSSDLIRAIRTQELMYPCEEVERLELIREMDVGELVGKHRTECVKIWGEGFMEDRNNSNFVPYGGENREMIGARAQKFLELLEKQPYERVAVFSHNGFICSVMRLVSRLKPTDGKFFCTNCSVSTFEYKDGVWKTGMWNYSGELGQKLSGEL
jgi:alpha-ribazole phosphatase